jgi:hypothetical protein
MPMFTRKSENRGIRSNKKKKWWNELREERGKDVETERQQLRIIISQKDNNKSKSKLMCLSFVADGQDHDLDLDLLF